MFNPNTSNSSKNSVFFNKQSTLSKCPKPHLFLRNLNLTVIDLLDDGRGVLTVDSAADRVASSQNLLHRAGELVGVGALAEDLGHLNDLIEGDVAAVLNYPLQLHL